MNINTPLYQEEIYANIAILDHITHDRYKTKERDIKNSLKKGYFLPKVDFIIDTTTTICAISKLEYFYSYKTTNKTVIWGKAKSIKVRYIGDIIVRTNTNYIYIIKNVLYIPELGINILSPNRLDNTISLFTRDKAYIYNTQNKPKRITFIGYKKDNLYKTTMDIIYPKGRDRSEAILAIQSNKKTTIKIWHERLGHIGLIPLKKILDQSDIDISKEDISNYIDNICEICLLSKYNRSIHKRPIDETDFDIGERIHSDIGGPISPKTFDGYIYYITFLDKKSRYLHVILLKSKDQAYQSFENYKNLSENQTKTTIKEFFTDNGTEYINNRYIISLKRYGIIHHKTPAYTKEPNGLIERINLTLLNKLRSLLIYSKSDQKL